MLSIYALSHIVRSYLHIKLYLQAHMIANSNPQVPKSYSIIFRSGVNLRESDLSQWLKVWRNNSIHSILYILWYCNWT